MSASPRATGAVLGALLGCALLGGCSFMRAHLPFRHHNASGGCSDKPFSGNSATRPGLVVPEGMSAPDTRGRVKIPPLTTAERVRAASEPCLDEPPAYGGYIARPGIRQGTPPPPPPPPNAPADAPAAPK